MKIGAVILAAGLSARMGAFKPLLRLGDKTMLAHCVELFRGSGVKQTVIVTGHRGEEVREEAQRLGVQWCINPQYQRGMLTSVQAGLRELGKLDGFFMLPVDIPLVRPATIRRLFDSFDGKKVFYPSFNGQRGHPPLIPGRLTAKIIRYDGPGGLDQYLQTRPSRDLPVWDRGILVDADTLDDFAVLEQRLSRLTIGEPEEALALAALTMPPRGVAHGRAVAGVALVIGRLLQHNGCAIDLDVVHNGALLHDIAKGAPLHEQRGGRLLAELGLVGLTDIVTAHRDIGPPDSGVLTEKEVVGLADKFVRGSSLVSLRGRYEEKLTRYASNPDACAAIRQRLTRAVALQELVEQRSGCSLEDVLAGGIVPELILPGSS